MDHDVNDTYLHVFTFWLSSNEGTIMAVMTVIETSHKDSVNLYERINEVVKI